MDADTLAALLRSIEKWENIVAGTGEDDFGTDCALCHKFFILQIFARDVRSPCVQGKANVAALRMMNGRRIMITSTDAETRKIAP